MNLVFSFGIAFRLSLAVYILYHIQKQMSISIFI
uniref:Uncharacterized protein n=1 Tax=Siphoviridae sp. ctBCr48 TaxID=2827802 RepID=A0A8S5SHE0_9CAUD|nr:MAG TPA: hypothetical protein [Siphoviridae sp. ctBCr48]